MDLQPLSFTPDLDKILEGLVKMVLEDITRNFDQQQYVNLKGCSTTHCLISLLDYAYKDLTRLRNLLRLT